MSNIKTTTHGLSYKNGEYIITDTETDNRYSIGNYDTTYDFIFNNSPMTKGRIKQQMELAKDGETTITIDNSNLLSFMSDNEIDEIIKRITKLLK